MGSHTCLPGSSSGPGSLTAYSTFSRESGFVCTFVSYCPTVRISSSIAPSWTSPSVPRVFTFDRTFLRSPTPVARLRISPSPLWTASSCALTSLKDSPSRFSRVSCSFSSTVRRISSSLTSLLSRSWSSLASSVPRSCSSLASFAPESSLISFVTASRICRWLEPIWPMVCTTTSAPDCCDLVSSSRNSRATPPDSSRAVLNSSRTARSTPEPDAAPCLRSSSRRSPTAVSRTSRHAPDQ